MDKDNSLKLKIEEICEQLIKFTDGSLGCTIDIPFVPRDGRFQLPMIETGSFVEKPIDEMFVLTHNSISRDAFTYFSDSIGHGSNCGMKEEEYGISVKEGESAFRILCLFDSESDPNAISLEISGDTAMLFKAESMDGSRGFLPVFTVTLIH